MTSTTPISTITVEPDAVPSNEFNEKEKFAKRFKPTNLKKNNQSKKPNQTSSSSITIRPLQAEDIKEHRIWALISLVFCFFTIAPCIAFYHSRRIRAMKENEELIRAKTWSDRVNNILVISNIIGIVIWVAIIFIIATIFIYGSVL